MSENVMGLIDAIAAGKSLEIENSFSQVMAEKLNSAIDLRREELSRNLLGAHTSVEDYDTENEANEV